MLEWQYAVERTNSPALCCWSTNKGSFSTDMYGCIFHSFSVCYNFFNAYSSETAADHLANRCGRQFEEHWSRDPTVYEPSSPIFHLTTEPNPLSDTFVFGKNTRRWTTS
jgi:hypothetical protein